MSRQLDCQIATNEGPCEVDSRTWLDVGDVLSPAVLVLLVQGGLVLSEPADSKLSLVLVGGAGAGVITQSQPVFPAHQAGKVSEDQGLFLHAG